MSKRQLPTELSVLRKKPRTLTITKLGFLFLRSLHTPFISPTTGSPFRLSCLRSDRLYTIGRHRSSRRRCNLAFHDPRVSKRHCQIFFDGDANKVFLLDGFVLLHPHSRRWCNLGEIKAGRVRPSLNGVFVNGVRVGKGKLVQLSAGDEVRFVCADDESGIKIGFVVEKIVSTEENVQHLVFNKTKIYGEKQLVLSGSPSLSDDPTSLAISLLCQCRNILSSADPIPYIQRCLELKGRNHGNSVYAPGEIASESVKFNLNTISTKTDLSPEPKFRLTSVPEHRNILQHSDHNGNSATVDDAYSGLLSNPIEDVNLSNSGFRPLESSPGKRFYLNRLDLKDDSSLNQHMVVSLPELLHPVQTLSRVFIATFTSDVLWFLSYCNVPNTLPVTIACHNTQRCWSSSLDERISTPYEDFPKLVLIYPPFPDDIAFGQDRKKQGIACHHPKLFVMQRECSIRVVVTSANLVSKQWNNVTNTVWWQDFPLRNPPDYSSLFTSTDEKSYEGVKSDFASQLAGFMASLVVDVPSQAHWIIELTKYDFGGANGHLVASVPGMHRHRTPYPLESMYFLSGNHYASRLTGMKFLGSVESSLVGLKYRFHTAADSNGAALKTLAAFIGKCKENAFGMSEVVLRRNHNILADANAVSVLICDLDEFSEGDYIQLGFLPRNTAKWVASLCDAGFFSFSAYIYPKEVLAAALEGSNNKVQLILYVSQGPCFSEMSGLLQPEHAASICSLIASLRRCVGLSRLHEVLGRYNWPELLETDFLYGSSSIGTSISSQFLAAFSSATGKRSIQFSESEESDPEWGRWNANDELKRPSMRIIFPTIERVKNSVFGIWPSRRMLCLSEGTWQRLRSADIFHDAVPYPSCRIGYPMHTKVARRRFESKTDASSFGWVYCGSHNFSAAAWGRPISSSSSKVGMVDANYFLGSRLRICNYELGIVFIIPPVDVSSGTRGKSSSIDDITLPFVVPAPKYRPNDRAATKKAMRDAIAELAELEKEISNEQDAVEEMMDEIPEEEMVGVNEYVAEEREEEKAYAEALWNSQVDSAEN